MNKRTFEKDELFNQGLKHSFVCNLWSWTKIFIDGSLSFISFVHWLSSFLGWVLFFVAPLFSWLSL